MRGNNTLVLNQATMIEALQVWANQKFNEPKPVVKSVKFCKVGVSEDFEIEVGEA